MSAAAGGAHEYARRVLKRPRHMNARGGSCCLGSESAYNAHAQILVMLAGDESVVEPWLLGWCWVTVRDRSVGRGGDGGKQIWTLDALAVPFIEETALYRAAGRSRRKAFSAREDDTLRLHRARTRQQCVLCRCKCDLEPALVPRPYARATLICRMAACRHRCSHVPMR